MLPLLLTALLGGTALAQEPVPSPEEIGQIQVSLTSEAGRRQLFPEAHAFFRQQRAISAEVGAALGRALGRDLGMDSLEVYLACDLHNQVLGYAVVAEEIGKYRPITFMVGVTPRFTVREVAVMVYRESRGGEVRRSRFLSQYRGKGLRDPLLLNRDIVNISGATLSVRALNVGVRKALLLLEALYGPQVPAPQADKAR